jgi:pyruvate kinase
MSLQFVYLNCCEHHAGCNADIHVIVKIESADSIPNLQSIISASDGVSFDILNGLL